MSKSSPTPQPSSLPCVTLSEQDGVRYLHLDSIWVQGAMRIARPHAIELDYVRRMMMWLLWRPMPLGQVGHAVQLGLGAGALTRFCHQRLSWACTVVEINEAVIQANYQWFRLPRDEGLKVVCADAADWIGQPEHVNTIDALQVDLYDEEAAGPVYDDAAFYRACFNSLREGGVMSVNLFGRHSSFERNAAHIIQAFGADFVWRIQATREGNTILIATCGVPLPPLDELHGRAQFIQQEWGLKTEKWPHLVSPVA
jgi:spermidine synthase